jgi:hypothetical protein
MAVALVGTLPAAGLLVAALLAGCGGDSGGDDPAGDRGREAGGDVRVTLGLDPSPPMVGPAAVTLELATAGGAPLGGAAVRLEGNMNHAGMRPSFATLEETAPGRYEGSLDFTMGGDWFVVVTAALPGGGRLERTIAVPGVRTP